MDTALQEWRVFASQSVVKHTTRGLVARQNLLLSSIYSIENTTRDESIMNKPTSLLKSAEEENNENRLHLFNSNNSSLKKIVQKNGKVVISANQFDSFSSPLRSVSTVEPKLLPADQKSPLKRSLEMDNKPRKRQDCTPRAPKVYRPSPASNNKA